MDGVVYCFVVVEGGWEIGGMIGGEGLGCVYGCFLCVWFCFGFGLDFDFFFVILVWMGRDGFICDWLVFFVDVVVFVYYFFIGI